MGEWLRVGRVVGALTAVVVGALSLRADGGAHQAALTSAQRERVRADWSQPRHGGSVDRVEIKRVTWGEFAAAADQASQFTVAASRTAPPTTPPSATAPIPAELCMFSGV